MKRVLVNERKLSENELDDFFPFPQRKEQAVFWKKFRKELASTFDIMDEDIQNKLLLGVPGFLSMRVATYVCNQFSSCIGIVIHSRTEKFLGCSCENGELEERQARYTLFSSSFC